MPFRTAFVSMPGNRKYTDIFEQQIQSVCKAIDRPPEFLRWVCLQTKVKQSFDLARETFSSSPRFS